MRLGCGLNNFSIINLPVLQIRLPLFRFQVLEQKDTKDKP